ncbi:MAG: hypothetical protein V4642_00050 [Bacteroidota bacterium]
MKNIPSQLTIVTVRTKVFNLDTEDNYPKGTVFTLHSEVGVLDKEGFVTIQLTTDIREKGKPKVICHFVGFVVYNIKEHYKEWLNDKTGVLDEKHVPPLLMDSYATLRGVLLEKISNTSLPRIVLPPISISDIARIPENSASSKRKQTTKSR